MKKYFVYILKCKDGSFYTGVTNNIEKRFFEHQEGLINSCYTHCRRPVEIVFAERFNQIKIAIEREKQIKGWSCRKKEALISGDWEKLPELSKCYSLKKEHPP
ncbi:MAG: GIY-YIG nuclease family protein [Nitrospinales bacterium]